MPEEHIYPPPLQPLLAFLCLLFFDTVISYSPNRLLVGLLYLQGHSLGGSTTRTVVSRGLA